MHEKTVLDYLSKLKGGLGLTFGTHFLHDFSIKFFFYLILYQWAKFQCHTFFPSHDIKQNVIKFMLRQLMMSQTIIFMLDQPLKQWLTGTARGEDGNTKI